MASLTKDRGITIGVDIMDMSILWECSIVMHLKLVRQVGNTSILICYSSIDLKQTDLSP